MEGKRAQAKARTAERRERRDAAAADSVRQENVIVLCEPEASDDVKRALRSLGFNAIEIREAVARCDAALRDGSVEERVRFALKSLAPRGRHPAA